MTKTTLRLPEPVMEKLRERSRQERRSVNDVAIDALLRGLGEESPNDAVHALGTLLERAATKRFSPQELAELRGRLALKSGDFTEDLDWVRGSDWS